MALLAAFLVLFVLTGTLNAGDRFGRDRHYNRGYDRPTFAYVVRECPPRPIYYAPPMPIYYVPPIYYPTTAAAVYIPTYYPPVIYRPVVVRPVWTPTFVFQWGFSCGR